MSLEYACPDKREKGRFFTLEFKKVVEPTIRNSYREVARKYNVDEGKDASGA